MKKPIKIALISFVALSAILLIAVVVLGSSLNRIVKNVVVSSGTGMLGTPVGLGEVKLSLREGSGGLYRLTIANPAGFSNANALELDEISLDLEIASVTTDEIVIERVMIDGARILLEEKAGATNLKTLSDRLSQKPAETSGTSTTEPAAESTAPKFVIKELRFTNAKVRIISEKLGGEQSATIPDIILKDVGRKGAGLTAAEVGKQVMTPVMRKVLESAGKKILEQQGTRGLRGLLDKALGG